MNIEALHAVAKLTQAYPKKCRGARSTKACLTQRFDDQLAFECADSRSQ